MTQNEENVVLFPFMAQGHIIPFLALALQIEQRRGYTVTFINTPLNIKKLRSSLPPNTTINLVELPFCSTDHNLPPNIENTEMLPYPLIIHLMEASQSFKSSFQRLIYDITERQHGHPPLCIIADMFFGWTIDVANELGIFHSIFNGGGAYGNSIYFSLWMHLPHCNTDSDEFSLPDLPEVSLIHRTQLANNIKNANGTDPWSLFIRKQLSLWLKTDGLLLNTVEELDKKGLQYFRKKTGRPVWSIGPTNSSLTSKAHVGKETAITLNQCVQWLNNHPQDSVLYISFGSQNTLSASQMMELAKGLETSGKNFIWVIRPPIGFNVNSEFREEEWLPEGYKNRMKQGNKGLLVHKWAPQLEILSHKSTCAFLSHCGWNSVLESLSNGKPIIGWPVSGEQYYNSKFLEEEVGVCVEVARGNGNEVRCEHVVKVIELVMGETQKRNEMKKRACEVREMIKDAVNGDEGFKGSSIKAMDDFFHTASSFRKMSREEREREREIV